MSFARHNTRVIIILLLLLLLCNCCNYVCGSSGLSFLEFYDDLSVLCFCFYFNYCQKKVLSQLWTSGLYPSAYWCGQAVVDIPIYFLILLLMQIMDGVFSSEEITSVVESLLIQVSGKDLLFTFWG